ncbi:hypothetical protein KY312_02075 [Candidatus Woesearchaeota archaeon]|nr:hypothetical protein [Candidatus Woesearchaeota archaeon]
MTYSIVEAIGTIDEMADQNPGLGDRFVKESRKYWAAKKEVFDYRKYYVKIAKTYPYLFAFKNWEDYKINYGIIVKQTLLRENALHNLDRITKDMIKWVRAKFKNIDPDDNTVLPLLINGKEISVLLPNDKVIPLYYGREYSKTG